MALSTCIKCGGHIFNVVEKELAGAQFKLNFVQCTACGGVVGVTEFYNIGKITKGVEAKVDALTSATLRIGQLLGVVDANIRKLFNR